MNSFKRLITAFQSSIPVRLRHALLRERFALPKNLDADFQFKVARTQDELKAAYRILYESNLERGLCQSHSCGMHLIKHFALPTTTTLIATHQQQVVGTICIIRKGAFGLPMESAFDLSELQNRNQTLAEVCGLAIHSKFRHENGAVLYPMLKFCWEHIQKNMNLDCFVLAGPPEMNDFFEGLLGMLPLRSPSVRSYSFHNGKPAQGYFQWVRDVPKQLKELYGLDSLEKNLFHYFTNQKIKNFDLPARKFYKSIDPVMTPEMLKFFFIDQAEIISKLSTTERLDLAAAYPDTAYREIIPTVKILKSPHRVRYDVNLKGRALSHPNLGLTVLNVSQSGICLSTAAQLSGPVQIRIQVAPNRISEVRGIIRWQDPARSIYGIQLLMSDHYWSDFVNYMEKDFENLAS
jgi:hypothetical protein